jgi:hypothetical protein
MINVNDYLLSGDGKPDWLIYPNELVDMIRLGRVKLVPWHLDKADASFREYLRLKSRLGRDLVPFAYRQDREDLACFEKGKGHPSFADWLRDAELEAASWSRGT